MDKKINVVFYKTASGNEPVREWLKSLDAEDRLIIGTDIKTVEYGWPIGMPVSRPLGNKLFEVRTLFQIRELPECFLLFWTTIWCC
jgi:hypothetical protein